MKHRRTIIGLVAAILVSACAAAVQATPGSGVTSTRIAKATAERLSAHAAVGSWKAKLDTRGTTDVVVTEHRLAPGGWFGWHSHPGPSIVVVKSGTLTFYRGEGECTGRTQPAGSSFVDPGGVVHTARNEGSEDVVLVTTQLIPVGAQGRIDQPRPAGCSF